MQRLPDATSIIKTRTRTFELDVSGAPEGSFMEELLGSVEERRARIRMNKVQREILNMINSKSRLLFYNMKLSSNMISSNTNNTIYLEVGSCCFFRPLVGEVPGI